MHEWIDKLWLSPRSPLYTWITSGFMHIELSHLVSNLIGLSSVAPICSRIHGMTPSRVFLITVGSSICASAALITEWRIRLVPGLREHLTHAIGASGIVCAFMAVAAAGAPRSSFSVNGINVPYWVVAVLPFGGDLAGLLRLDELMTGKQKSWLGAVRRPLIGYAAHLGGAIFGIIYYYAVLQQHAAEATESTAGQVETCGNEFEPAMVDEQGGSSSEWEPHAQQHQPDDGMAVPAEDTT